MGTTRIDADDVPVYSPVCSFCRHLNPGGARKCKAFPKEDSIPLAIWTGENPHTAPVEGDHGIQFEAIEGTP